MHDLLIENVKLVDIMGRNIEKSDVYIKNKVISKISHSNSYKEPCYKRINGENNLLLPGLIDLYTNKIDNNAIYNSGFVAQTIGPEHDENIKSQINIYRQSSLTLKQNGQSIAPVTNNSTNIICGLSNGNHPIINTKILLNCYLYAASFGLKVFIHCNDYFLKQNGVIHEGDISAKFGINGIPEISESIDLQRHLELIEYTGIAAHFHKITTRKGIEIIKQAKDKGLPITADVAIANLLYQEHDLKNFDPNFHLTTPIRSANDQQALINAVLNKTIDGICSDHAPIANIHKKGPFALTTPGMATLETFVTQFFKLFDINESNIFTVFDLITKNPAKILGINKEIFKLRIGNKANFCLYDPNLVWEVNSKSLQSFGNNTPLLNNKIKGRVQITIKDGIMLFKEISKQPDLNPSQHQ